MQIKISYFCHGHGHFGQKYFLDLIYIIGYQTCLFFNNKKKVCKIFFSSSIFDHSFKTICLKKGCCWLETNLVSWILTHAMTVRYCYFTWGSSQSTKIVFSHKWFVKFVHPCQIYVATSRKCKPPFQIG